ncbi:hypothetical protein, partial [Candidatus Ichthyocystis sparus]
ISLVLGGSEISRAGRVEGGIATPEVVSEVIVIQELEEVLVVEEEEVSGSNVGSIRVLEDGGTLTVIAAEIEASGGDIVSTTHSQVPDTPEQGTRDSDGGPTLAPDLVIDIIEVPTKLKKKRKFLVESEEERNKKKLARLAESKAVMEMKEREKKERLRKREENATRVRKERQEKKEKLFTKEQKRKKEVAVAVKRREGEIETALSVAVCREADLEKVKNKVKGIMARLETPGSLSSTKRDIEMMEAKERELRGVIAEPRLEDLQKMEKELTEVRARYRELEQAGAGGVSLDIDCLRIKETRVRADIERAVARETKVKNLEKELEVLVARELGLERIGIRKGELDKVRTKKIRIEKDLDRLRATIAITEGSLELELKLGEFIKERKRIEATIDGVKRGIELNRLKEGAKSELGERELDMTLRLEGINVRAKVLELELGLWLGKIIAKKIETEKVATSIVPGGSETVREDREESNVATTPELVSEATVMQELEEEVIVIEGEEEGASSVNIISTREIDEGGVVVVKIRDLELELEEAVRLERSRKAGERAITASRGEELLELELRGVRAQERNLGLELDGVMAHAMNLDRGIWEVGVISDATSAEIEAKRDRLKELNRNRALARVRELELRIGLSRARLRARGLVLALEKLKVVAQDQN